MNFPVLKAPEFEKTFQLAIDASEIGADDVTLQEDATESITLFATFQI